MCSARFDDANTLIAHFESYHNDSNSPQTQTSLGSIVDLSQSSNDNNSTVNICPNCQARFNDPVDLVNHFESKHSQQQTQTSSSSMTDCIIG